MMNITDTSPAERLSIQQGVRELRADSAREAASYRNSPQGQPGYVPTWAPRPAFQSIGGYLCGKPGDQITREEAEEALQDLQANPRVKSVSISQFHPVQKRWLFNIHLVDGINGELSGEYSIGRIYGDLRNTEAGWQEYLKEREGQQQEDMAIRAEMAAERWKMLDDAAAEAIAMLAKAGFTVDDVTAAINRMIAGRYVDEEWKMTRAFNFHSEVICPKFAHMSDRDRPVQMRIGFYYGARRYRIAND